MIKESKKLKIIIFLLLPFTLISIFVLYPIVYTIVLSFIDKETRNFTINNYIHVITSTSPIKMIFPLNLSPIPPWGALIHNLIWIVIHVPVTTFCGLALAYIFKFHVKGGNVIKAAMFIGMVIPPAIGGLLTMFMFYERVGVFPMMFDTIGIKSLAKTWLLYKDTALWGLIIGSIWFWMGFAVTVFSAGLEAVPISHYEAARVFGASSWQVFWKVVVPQLKPVTTVVVIMTALWDMKIFDFVWGATKGGPLGASNVLAVVMYDYFIRDIDWFKASTVAVFLTIFVLPIIIIAIRMMRE